MNDPAPGLTALNQRDLSILKALGLNQTTKEIAFSLGISDKTVEYHIGPAENPRSLYAKTGCNSRAALVRFAVENRLVQRGETAKEPPKPLRSAVKVMQNTDDMAQALLEGAARAAAGTADVLQLNALCHCSDALCRLASFTMQAEQRCSQVPWLKK